MNPLRLLRRAPGAPRVGASGYSAFISYNRDSDEALAAALQEGIEKYARPWNRARAAKVFRDKTSLPATARLWSALVAAMSRSSWFMILASPESAASGWVRKEVAWWVGNKPASNIVIVLTAGQICWDQERGDFDWRRTDALPESLRHVFDEEPFWMPATWARAPGQITRANPQLQDVAVTIAAAIRDTDKDDLVATADREYRRTRRLARGAVTALVSLLALAVTAAALATVQRNHAVHLTQVSISRQLASASESELGTSLDSALLLAAQAYRTNPNAQTLGALMQADTSSPHLVRYLSAGATVTQLLGSEDGRTIVAGLVTGQVLRWPAGGSRPRVLFRLRAPISSLAVSGNGNVIVASDGSGAYLWRPGRPLARLPVLSGQAVDGVAISPSGQTAVVHAWGRKPSLTTWVTIIDLPQLRRVAVHADPVADSEPVLPSDSGLLLINGGGAWQWRSLPAWRREHGGAVGLGTAQLSASSASGLFFTGANGSATVPVWRTDSRGGYGRYQYTARIPAALLTTPRALALSPDGSRLAIAGSGQFYVAPVARRGSVRAPAIQLTGSGTVSALSFLGRSGWLLSASGSKVGVWNLHQVSRLMQLIPAHVELGCEACAGPGVVISPDGRRAGIVDGSGADAVIQPLPGTGGQQVRAPENFLDYTYDQPVWQGSRRLVLPVSPPSGGSDVQPPASANPALRILAGGNGTAPVAAAGMARGGRNVIEVDSFGRIFVQDARTGAIRRIVPGVPGLPQPDESVQGAAVDPATGEVAISYNGAVRLVPAAGDGTSRHITVRGARQVAFAGRKLLVQLSSGVLQVWDDQATTRERVIGGSPGYGPPAANPQGTLVARQETDGSIDVDDLASGAVLDTIPALYAGRSTQTGLAFTPDGRHLIIVVSGTGPGTSSAELIEVDLSAGSLLRAACSAAGTALTGSQWRAVAGTAPPADLACQR